MAITQKQLDSFHEFAKEQLDNNGSELTFADLYEMWRIQQPTDDELAENVAAVKAAIRDLEQGDRGVPFEDHIRELRQKYNIPTNE